MFSESPVWLVSAFCRAPLPRAVFLLPVLLVAPAWWPTNVLLLPVCRPVPASRPARVLLLPMPLVPPLPTLRLPLAPPVVGVCRTFVPPMLRALAASTLTLPTTLKA